MNRVTRCRNAAVSIMVVTRGLPALTSPERRAAMTVAKERVLDILDSHFANGPERAIDDLSDEDRSHEQNVRVTDYDPRDDDPDYRSPTDRLRRAMTEGLGELDGLTSHICSYSEGETTGDLICGVCGNSGLT